MTDANEAKGEVRRVRARSIMETQLGHGSGYREWAVVEDFDQQHGTHYLVPAETWQAKCAEMERLRGALQTIIDMDREATVPVSCSVLMVARRALGEVDDD